MILVSACLLGINCKYNGKHNEKPLLIKALKGKKIIPVCPEQLGGLTTPRLPAEIQGGDGEEVLIGKAKVITENGEEVTENFIRGAQETLKVAKVFGATEAILKSKSPSCGTHMIYDGTFSGKLKKGVGITTALLRKNGVEVWNEETFIDRLK